MVKFIGVTSCATGIAHSYMAAEALENIANKLGLDHKVEIQGALGIENRITEADLRDTEFIIFANDVNITEIERFNSLRDKIIQFSPHEVIRNPKKVEAQINSIQKG
ncbi:PTS fructose transporter subunit IIB [Tetragenococcus solitarius]|uniref:PTS EIIB type-2 domain-containing protein n=1 Tax=Tetragenococcus solitarius TaxID=71453 RepID=A0ABN3Y869_9ENTE|nr:fructose PTS transporter subunit IIB [Tetragenococcus solitarius]